MEQWRLQAGAGWLLGSNFKTQQIKWSLHPN